jgi:excisionase family DNA binding protein
MDTLNTPPPFFLETYLTVQIAAELSGYNAQYLWRLLRDRKLEGDKIGQTWLIKRSSFDEYVGYTKDTADRRFGPK